MTGLSRPNPLTAMPADELTRAAAGYQLGWLADRLNIRYDAPLAVVETIQEHASPFLRVQRGTSHADVVVAVSVQFPEPLESPDVPGAKVPGNPRFHLEAFTETAWSGYGDAFSARVLLTLDAAVEAVCQYVQPLHA